MGTDARFRLKRLEVEGFRGVNRRVALDFAPNATLLLAANGQGKTSLLAAIEWCLFGRLQYQAAENVTRDEIVNLHHPACRASVRLGLERDGETVWVERARGLRKRETEARVVLPSGEIHESDAAEALLFRLLGLGFDDFYRAVYLHQESVRGLLLDDPRVRDEALDRLFGLDRLRDVLAAIPMKVVRDAIEDIQKKKDSALTKLTGAAEQVEEHRRRYQQEATDLGLAPAELTLTTAHALVGEIRADLERACAAARIAPPVLVDIAAIDDCERIARRAKETIRTARSGSGSGVGTATRRTTLDRLADRLDTASRDIRSAEDALRAHRDSVGSDEALAERHTELSGTIERARRQLDLFDSEQRMLSDALAYIDRTPDARSCPVCAQPVDVPQLASSLRQRVTGALREEHERLHAEIAQATAGLDDLAEVQRVRNGLATTRSDADGRLRVVLDEARSALGLGAMKGERAVREALAQEQSALAAAAQVQEQLLQRTESAVEKLRALARVLGADEDFAAVRAKGVTDDPGESATLDAELERLSTLQESLEAISGAVTGVARSRARDAVDGSRESISRYYQALCNHPYFDGVRVDVQERSVQGMRRNSYAIRAYATSDGRETLASTRLSTAQMNGVALSIYLALATALAHSLGFVILDDPSQSLDAEHKAALVSILAAMAPRTQLVLATQDTELQKLLRRDLLGEGSRAYELQWSRAGVAASQVR